MKKSKKNKGFTLIELIVVIAILAILAAVAVPNFIGLTKKANTATEVAAAAEYANAINIYNALSATDIANAAVGTLTAANVSVLGTDLTPVTEFDATKLVSNVLARITISEGTAKVTNKAAIGT